MMVLDGWSSENQAPLSSCLFVIVPEVLTDFTCAKCSHGFSSNVTLKFINSINCFV